MIVPYGSSLPQQKGSEFQKEDKAGERKGFEMQLYLPAEPRALSAPAARQVSVLGAGRGAPGAGRGEEARLPRAARAWPRMETWRTKRNGAINPDQPGQT